MRQRQLCLIKVKKRIGVLLVTSARRLAPATVAAILTLVRRTGQDEALTQLLQEISASRVAFALHRLGLTPLPLKETPPVPGSAHELYTVDTDKTLYVLTVTEPINPRTHSKQHGWQLDLPDLDRFQHPPDCSETLCLVILAEHGHAFRVGVSRRAVKTPDFLFRIDDLETFASAHQGEPLALWRLARSMRALREQVIRNRVKVSGSNP